MFIQTSFDYITHTTWNISYPNQKILPSTLGFNVFVCTGLKQELKFILILHLKIQNFIIRNSKVFIMKV